MEIVIAEIGIRQDEQGRFSLNDLHRAAGGELRHKPGNWLMLEQTKALVAEIGIAGITAIQSKQGTGTFVVKELVYAYAMWISPAFHLKVIRAYDSMVSASAPSFQIPQTYAEALQLAADQAKQLEAAKPAVEFVERYVEAKQSQCLTDVAKIIGWRPRGFISQLEKDGILFHRGTWLPRQEQIDAGRFEVKTGEEKGFAFRQTRVTPKGITWLAQRYGVGTELTH